LGTSIASAISGAVKSGINRVISLIQNTINNAIGLINGAIGLINKLPGVSVSKINTLSLPRLAKGGIVDSPTLAEVGEQGREAIIPLENNKEWIKELAAELSNVMVTPLTEFTREATTTNITNNMYKELVSAFKDALSQMKVTLDDEELGNFVEKTVADAIYT
jgi:SLT domain-containing protein